MSTRSLIAILNADQSVTSVYCHQSGDPKYMLPQLNHYNNEEKLQELLGNGAMFLLRHRIGEKHPYSERYEYDCCTFFHRDGGEALTIGQYPSLQDWLDSFNDLSAKNGAIEYAYLFENGRWVGYAQYLLEKGHWVDYGQFLLEIGVVEKRWGTAPHTILLRKYSKKVGEFG